MHVIMFVQVTPTFNLVGYGISKVLNIKAIDVFLTLISLYFRHVIHVHHRLSYYGSTVFYQTS